MPVAVLERLLDNANRIGSAEAPIKSVTTATNSMPSFDPHKSPEPDEEESSDTSTDTDITVPNGDKGDESDKKLEALKGAIAQLVGIAAESMPEQANCLSLATGQTPTNPTFSTMAGDSMVPRLCGHLTVSGQLQSLAAVRQQMALQICPSRPVAPPVVLVVPFVS